MKDVYQRRAKPLGHGGQIITTRWTILDFIRDIQCPVAYNTVYLISEGLYGREDDLRLYSVCSRLYYLSKLVYKGEDGVKKLDADQYRIKIFEPNAETREEIVYILKRMYEKSAKVAENIEDSHIDQVIRCLDIIEKLWSKGISCVCEQIYIPELAYAFDYVIKHRGVLPEPEFQGEWSIFPQNYEAYNYTEGIADIFENIMESIF